MRRELLAPTLLAGGIAIVLTTTGLAARGGGGDGVRLASIEASPLVHGRHVPGRSGGTHAPAGPTTTVKVAPTTTTTSTTTTTAPPPSTATTAPPEPGPQPEVRSGGGIVCPVAGPTSFVDSWGAARSGGRSHQGTDMMADHGTPTVAPVSGTVEHRGSSVGGLSWYVHGDDGNTYFGTHLSGYANEGAGWVAAGTVIGYVGDTGNAAGTPHLHFEYHPGGGSPANSYPLVAAAC